MQWKKWTSVALTATLSASMLAACGGGNSGSGNGGGSTGDSGAAPSEAPSNLNKTGMPIVNEPINMTFFTGKSGTNGNNFEETLVWSKYAEMSNINVNFDLVPFENLTEKRNLTLASGDYPDGFYTSRLTSADIAKYGAQGVFLKLDDLIDEYAPNFKALMDQYPMLRKGLTMPDGHIYSFPSFYDPTFPSMLIGTPLWVNQEWLEQLGMEEPTTIDEFYNYLVAVKETDLNGNGLNDEIPYSGTGIGALIDQLKGAWGLGNRGLAHKFVDIDPQTNEPRFFRTTEEYKEVLEFVHKLYSEGLLDEEIFTIKSSALYVKGQEGLLGSTIVPNPKTLMNQDSFIGLGALEGPHGDNLYSHVKAPIVHVGAFVLTHKNENPEAAVRWMDHFFGEEGALFYFMGEEGVTYNKNADGTLDFTEEITNNPNGLTQDQALAKYVTWLGGSYPGYVQEHYFKGSESLPESIAAGEKAEPYMVEEIWNGFNYTEEETDFMSSVGKDIQDYITEMEAKFVNGSSSFAEWDSYISNIERMGLDRYMEVYTTAYERYNQAE